MDQMPWRQWRGAIGLLGSGSQTKDETAESETEVKGQVTLRMPAVANPQQAFVLGTKYEGGWVPGAL
jgi:hypothetical protein